MTQEEFDARLDEGEDKGWVYLIEAGQDGPIKVGWARDPLRRLNDLQTGQHEQLNLVGLLPGTKHLETAIHRKLGTMARRGGEWFDRGAVLRMLNPAIREHGVKLTVGAVESRNSPGMRGKDGREKRDFLVEIAEA